MDAHLSMAVTISINVFLVICIAALSVGCIVLISHMYMSVLLSYKEWKQQINRIDKITRINK
jgi:hypothetical protein